MALNSYEEVQAFFNKFVQDKGVDVTDAPHADFWNTMTYSEFTTGLVPNVTDNTGAEVRLLVPGNSAGSNLIIILKGKLPGGIRRMPGGGPPWMSDDLIKELADWIDRNCPN